MSALAGVRSILETPILDARKWAKMKSVDCDAVLLDLEDSVSPARKLEARERVLKELQQPEALGRRLGLPRVNALDTEWGGDDLRALAEAGVRLLIYPKLSTVEELAEVRRRSNGAEVIVIVETAQAVLNLEAIARAGVAGFINGPADLANDVGWDMFIDGALNASAYGYLASKLVLVQAAFATPVYDTVFVEDLRDQAQVNTAVQRSRSMGFAGAATFYPPHVSVINEAFSPSADQVSRAMRTVEAYEDALAKGDAAVRIGGEAVIVQYYKKAQGVLARAGIIRNRDAGQLD
ncbi:MAG: malyl-CoA thiolesterase [Enterovirga sp.]|nr:malyl-CoA thiolesterase [Enterovirga sp.]